MTTPLGDARDRLVGILTASNLGVPVHAAPPDVVSGPCIWVRPGYDWLGKNLLGPTVRVQLEVEAAVPVVGGVPASLAAVERLTWSVWRALTAAALEIEPARAPETRAIGTSTMLVSSTTVTQQVISNY